MPTTEEVAVTPKKTVSRKTAPNQPVKRSVKNDWLDRRSESISTTSNEVSGSRKSRKANCITPALSSDGALYVLAFTLAQTDNRLSWARSDSRL